MLKCPTAVPLLLLFLKSEFCKESKSGVKVLGAFPRLPFAVTIVFVDNNGVSIIIFAPLVNSVCDSFCVYLCLLWWLLPGSTTSWLTLTFNLPRTTFVSSNDELLRLWFVTLPVCILFSIGWYCCCCCWLSFFVDVAGLVYSDENVVV